ncbi:MAG: hypothetical protein OQL18_10225 [Deltaproteobacteria bacterium]|jgi:hypothetical protein|nr:hypothetical protein [Deltaproteobacteria bacterium]
MEKVGLALTPIHHDEHKKLLREITLFEFSWKAKRISNDVYRKSINYKLVFFIIIISTKPSDCDFLAKSRRSKLAVKLFTDLSLIIKKTVPESGTVFLST